ncbi:MAG TPA: hypothetical protein VD884_08160 [Ohtaekwangia sp.]|nr:hypothetical protein [Ohtaekwangia sp.]
MALGDLNDEVAYVGGATVSIYADDPIAEDVRPTKDVDIMLRIATFAELAALQDKLASKKIYPDPEANVNCRFKYDDVLIDVMSTKEVGWAPSDPWFEAGFKSLMKYKLDDEVTYCTQRYRFMDTSSIPDPYLRSGQRVEGEWRKRRNVPVFEKFFKVSRCGHINRQSNITNVDVHNLSYLL